MHTTRARPATTVPTRGAFFQGVRAMTPMVIGLVPFGIAIGSASAALDVDRTAAWAGSWLVLAGAAQLAVIQLIDGGAAPLAVIAAALMINARYVVYSAGLAEWFPSATRRTRLLLAIPVVDQLYITAVARFEQVDLAEDDRRRFYAGAATHLASAWVVAQTIGVVVGDQLPSWMGLHHAALLAMAGLLARSLNTRPARIAAAVAAAAAIVAAGLPHHSVIVVAMLAGMAAGAPRRRT